MGFVPAAHTCEVALRMSCDGVLGVNTLYFRAASAWTSVQMENLAADVTGWWGDNIAPITPPAVSLNEVYVLGLDSATDPSVLSTAFLPVVGSESANPLPLNVTCAIGFRTANRGRSYRGRNYFFGFPDTAQTSVNQMSSAFHDALLAAYQAIPTDITYNGATHVVVSRYHDHALRVTAVVSNVTSYTLDTDLDSMRKRLTGRGV